MKVCVLTSSDGRYGGFSAVVRFHKNIMRYGYRSSMLVANKKTDEADVVEVGKFKYFLNKLFLYTMRLYRKMVETEHEPEYYFEHMNISGYTAEELVENMPFEPDVIVAGWVDGFISPKVLHDLSKNTDAIIIWYLMDMAPLTGGCHFSWGCNKYEMECGSCPAIKSNKENDISRRNIINKKKYLAGSDLVVVSATEWLHRQAIKSSSFRNCETTKIMLGVDEQVFKPISKIVARKKLNIPEASKVVFFGATSLEFKRKGMSYLYQALDILEQSIDVKSEKIVILSAGSGSGEEVSSLLSNNYNHIHLDYLKDDSMLALAYQASNLYVCPSIEDSGPMMINESVMCGTPVVAFEMGGALDLVHTGKTGYRARLKDSNDLSDGIKYVLLLTDEEQNDMSVNCRSLAMENCSPKVQINRFAEVISNYK